MTRTEENTEMMDSIYKQINEHPYKYDVEEVNAMALLDISKSLAVIADYLKKEENNYGSN